MKKYFDEGPSNRPIPVSELSPASDEEEATDGDDPEYVNVNEESENSMAMEDLKELEEDTDSEYEYPTLEALRKCRVMEGHLMSPKVMKPRPLNLTDDFEIIGGAPTVELKNQKGKESLDGYVFSCDGSRMAARYIQGIVKIYDVLDNFSFVASHQFDNPIKFVDFWNGQNDELVVVLWDRKVLFVSIKDVEETHNGSSQDENENSELQVVQLFEVVHPDQRVHFNSIEVNVCKTTMWIIERELCLDKALLLTSICQDVGMRQIRIYSGFDVWPSTFWLSIFNKMIVAIVENNQCKTKILKNIEVEQPEMKINPINIVGCCIGMSNDGNQLAIWREDEHGLSFVDVYSHKDLKHGSTDTLSARYSIELTFGLINIRGEFLDESFAPIDDFRLEQEEELLELALLISRSCGVNFLICEPHSGKVIKEIDLSPRKNQLKSFLDIEYSLSRNKKWIATFYHQNNTLNLFSFTSGSPIWSYAFDGRHGSSLVRGSLRFSCSNNTLCLGYRSVFLAFFLPCFAPKNQLEPEVSSFSFQQVSKTLPSVADVPYRQLSKPFLFSISNRFLPKGFLDVTYSLASSRMAIALKITAKVHVFIKNSFGGILSEGFNKRNDEWYLDECLTRSSEIIVEEFDIEMHESIHIFFYPNQHVDNNESIVVFNTHPSLEAVFIDFDGKKSQSLVKLDNKECYWYSVKQTSNRFNASCLGLKSVWVIDMTQQCVTHKIEYKFWTFYWIQLLNLCRFRSHYFSYSKKYVLSIVESKRSEGDRYISVDKKVIFRGPQFQELVCLCKRHRFCDFSCDGLSVLLGWNVTRRERLVVTKNTTMEDIIKAKQDGIIPCWALTTDFEQVAFLRGDEKGYIKELCIYNLKSKILRRVAKGEWNEAQRRELTLGLANNMKGINFILDKDKGALNVQLLKANGLTIVPIAPYSLEECIPSLRAKEWIKGNRIHDQFEECANQIGPTFFNMSFDGKSNLEVAVVEGKNDILSRIFETAIEDRVVLNIAIDKRVQEEYSRSLMRIALKNNDEQTIRHLLGIINKRYTHFQDVVCTMEDCFQDLWIHYNDLMCPMMMDNAFVWNIQEIYVPAYVFQNEGLGHDHVVVSNTMWQWENEGDEEVLLKQWNIACNPQASIYKNKLSRTKRKASIKRISIEDTCKVGLKGIVRRLLFQSSPPYIFNTDCIRWVLTWKWHNVWKHRSIDQVLYYLFFLVVLTTYGINSIYIGEKLHEDVWVDIFLTLFLHAAMAIAFDFAKEEFSQLRTYIKEGRKIFPNDQLWGVKYYLSSAWNIFETILYFLIFVGFGCLHILSLMDSKFIKYYQQLIAITIVLTWIKLWYFAQAFESTGALVLMIENIVRDCLSFVLLVGCALIGFGLALYVAFHYSLDHSSCNINEGQEGECKESEIKEQIDMDYGSPWKAILTMFYAMLGTFEPEVYFRSGFAAPLIILIVVAFLALLMVVLFNMLIAIMGDTFDRVKSTEEEQLMYGRARFIDACEAGLSREEIKELENVTGKYLYVLTSSTDNTNEALDTWQGRVKTLEGKVKVMIDTCEKNIKEDNKKQSKRIEEVLKEFQGMKEDLKHIQNEQKRNETQSALYQKEIKYEVKEGFKMMLEHTQKKEVGSHERFKLFEKHFTTQIKEVDLLEAEQYYDETQPTKEQDEHKRKEALKEENSTEHGSTAKAEILEETKHAMKTDAIHVIKEVMQQTSIDDIVFDDLTELIHEASRYNAIESTKFLITRGVDVESKNIDSKTPLHIATLNNSIDVANILIAKGANIDLQDNDGKTPLHHACARNLIDIGKILIEKGANVSIQENDGLTPLHFVALNEQIDFAKILIDEGIDINLQENNGRSPMHLVSFHNSIDLAKILIDEGANVDLQDNSGGSPLHSVAIRNSIDVAKMLIAKGANAHLQNNNGWSPLHTSSVYNSIDIAKLLVDQGANIDAQDSDRCSPLHCASYWNSIDVAKILIEGGANIDIQDKNGETPLHNASSRGDTFLVKILLENGGSKSITSNEGKTPFDVICHWDAKTNEKTIQDLKDLLAF